MEHWISTAAAGRIPLNSYLILILIPRFQRCETRFLNKQTIMIISLCIWGLEYTNYATTGYVVPSLTTRARRHYLYKTTVRHEPTGRFHHQLPHGLINLVSAHAERTAHERGLAPNCLNEMRNWCGEQKKLLLLLALRPYLVSKSNELKSAPVAALRSPFVSAPKLASRLATADANRRSPPKSVTNRRNTGAEAWLLLWLLPSCWMAVCSLFVHVR